MMQYNSDNILNALKDKLKSLNGSYKMLLDLYTNSDDAKDHGICFAIMYLYKMDFINHSQFFDLKSHFRNNKPSEHDHPEFINNKSFIGTSVWWDYSDESIEQRKLFLNKMILITDPENNDNYKI